MDLGKAIDLALLLEHVPPLLEACICNEAASLRKLRLVNKEWSRVALLGLRSYTVTLKGGPADTNINGASLLQQTKLQSLEVHLLLSGSYSPAVLLRGFVQEAGPALTTVTHLKLCFQTTGYSTATRAKVIAAMTVLVSACPALTVLQPFFHPSPAFLRSLGETCPLLTTLDLFVGHPDRLDVDEIVQLQPSLLPSIHSLILRGLDDTLPDMSTLTGVRSLQVLQFYPSSKGEWHFMPPNLESLACAGLIVGPSSAFSSQGPLLANLLSLHITSTTGTNLHALAQLVRAAPVLQSIRCSLPEDTKDQGLVVKCLLGPSTAADLLLLHRRLDFRLFKDATYHFDLTFARVQPPFLSLISSLPCMTGFTSCELDSCTHEDLVALLRVFPDARKLALSFLPEMDDVKLRAVTTCAALTTLKLTFLPLVTPMGLLALHLHVPRLRYVSCAICVELQQPALDMCAHLLKGYGRDVVFIDDTNG